MSELALGALVAGSALAAALFIAFAARGRERRRAKRVQLDLAGIEGRVVFFSDAACRRCDVVRNRLESVAATFTEIAYDRQPELQRRVGVTGVPLVVIRDERGAEVGRIAGVVSEARLRRAIRSAS